jgi:hypothetical protein
VEGGLEGVEAFRDGAGILEGYTNGGKGRLVVVGV